MTKQKRDDRERYRHTETEREKGIFKKGVLKTLVMLIMSIIWGVLGLGPKIKNMKHIVNTTSVFSDFRTLF